MEQISTKMLRTRPNTKRTKSTQVLHSNRRKTSIKGHPMAQTKNHLQISKEHGLQRKSHPVTENLKKIVYPKSKMEKRWQMYLKTKP